MKLKMVMMAVMVLSFLVMANNCQAQDIQKSIQNAQTTANGTTINVVEFPVYVGAAVKFIIAMAGVLFLAMIVWSGINWMISAGDAARITKSKTILIYSTLGLMIVLTTYIIVVFLLSRLGISNADDSNKSFEDSSVQPGDNILPQPDPRNPNPEEYFDA